MAKTRKSRSQGRFLVWTYTRSGGSRTLGRFHDRKVALSFARAQSLTLKNQMAYVDDEGAEHGHEPIATYNAGMSRRI